MTAWTPEHAALADDLREQRTPQEAERLAYDHVQKLEPVDLIRHLVEAIGVRMTAASLGMTDAQPLKDWLIHSKEPHDYPVLARKAQLLFRLVHPLTLVYSVDTAAGFLQRRSEVLAGEAPLVVLADDSSGEQERALLTAMRRLLY
jgi:hypothetical protein